MAEVDAWLAKYDNPMKPVVQRVREIILGADARMRECIKWQAPTFVYEGNLASFFPKAKTHASLMFHQGARIPGTHPILLPVQGDTGKIMKLASVEEADAARADIEAVVKAWIAWRDSTVKQPAKAATPKTSAKPKTRKAKAKAATPKTSAKPKTRKAKAKATPKTSAKPKTRKAKAEVAKPARAAKASVRRRARSSAAG